MSAARRLLGSWIATSVLTACVADTAEAPGAPSSGPTLPTGPYRATGGGLAGASYVWTDRSEGYIPRMLPGVVDQPARNRLLVYGGWQENGVRFDTWEWDGKGWIRRHPLHDPGTRVGPAIAYDEVRQRVLLTGGADDFLPSLRFAERSTTWEWNGDDWSQLSVLHSPPPAAIAGSTWDPDRSRMLVYGGFLPPGTLPEQPKTAPGSDQLWAFDGFDWTQIPRTEPWPPASGLNSLTYDRARHRLVLFSGFRKLDFTEGVPTFGSDDNGAAIYSPIGDTWEWDGTSWTQTGKSAGNAGFVVGGTLFYDPNQQSVGLLLTELDVVNKVVVQGYRAYQGASWPTIANVTTTAKRILVNASWSSANQAAFSFGGVLLNPDNYAVSTNVALDEAIVGNPWIVQPTPVQMPALHHASHVTEDDGSTTVFGGQLGNDVTNDAYSWNGGRWTRLELTGEIPPARSGAAMSRFGKAAVLFGGKLEGDTLTDDTWTWNPGTRSWKLILPTSKPSPRQQAAMFELTSGAYLYGGNAGDELTDTWRFQEGEWSNLGAAPAPSDRTAPCVASLPDRQQALLTGGTGVSDVWTFGGAWTQELPGSGMGLRGGCGMAFDSSLGQLLMVGGLDAPGTQDLWSMTPTIDAIGNARNIEARGELPPRRAFGVYADNPSTGGTVLFGGVRNDTKTDLADTWQLRVFGLACTSDDTCKNGAFCTEGVCCEVKSCGPCATCAAGGLCQPRPAGPQPGCDGNAACNADGQCRLGTGQSCADNDACAGGACTKSTADAGAGVCCGIDGCAVACVDDRQLRNAQGELTDCGAYKCVGSACTTSCATVNDCAGGFVCDQTGKCVPPEPTEAEDSSGCGCVAAGARIPGSRSLLGVGALALVAAWRRRRAAR